MFKDFKASHDTFPKNRVPTNLQNQIQPDPTRRRPLVRRPRLGPGGLGGGGGGASRQLQDLGRLVDLCWSLFFNGFSDIFESFGHLKWNKNVETWTSFGRWLNSLDVHLEFKGNLFLNGFVQAEKIVTNQGIHG